MKVTGMASQHLNNPLTSFHDSPSKVSADDIASGKRVRKLGDKVLNGPPSVAVFEANSLVDLMLLRFIRQLWNCHHDYKKEGCTY